MQVPALAQIFHRISSTDILELPQKCHLMQPYNENKISFSVPFFCLACWDCFCAVDKRYTPSVANYRDWERASLEKDNTKDLSKCQVKKKSESLRTDKYHHHFTQQLLNKFIQSSFAMAIHELKKEIHFSLPLFCQCVLLWGLLLSLGPLGLNQLYCTKPPC